MSWLLTMTLVISAIMLFTHLYLSWRFTRVTAYFSSKGKWLPILFLLSFYLLPLSGLIHTVTGGDPDLLAYPHWVTYWFWFGFVMSFQWLTYTILLDLLKWISRVVTNLNPEKIYSFYCRAVLAAAILLFVFTAIKMRYDTRKIDIKQITVESQTAPNGFDGFRIVHISDLQGDEYTGRSDIANYIQKVNNLNPDLVIFTGDLISYGTDFIDMAAEELSKVKATYGLYAVIGDHDYWAGVEYIQDAYQKYGVNLLRDENTAIPVNGDSLLLTGITEVYSKQIERASLQQLATAKKDAAFKIMAAHQATPKVVEVAQEQHYQILLGGHTHGGQVRVPFMFMHFSAPSFETDYLSGLYKSGGLLLNINNGLGFTLAPIRYDAQPSISVITLSPKP